VAGHPDHEQNLGPGRNNRGELDPRCAITERTPLEARVEETTPISFPAIVWLVYGLGAVLAGATYRWWAPLVQDLDIAGDVRWSSAALAVPIAIVAVVALTVVGKWHGRRAIA
jgi:hypothetical protein